MTIAIIGSPDFPDLDMVRSYLRSLPKGLTIATGRETAMDLLVIHEAFDWGLISMQSPRLTGESRVHEIVESADRVLVYWTGSDDVALEAIRLARAAKKELAIIGPDGRKMRPPAIEAF